MKNSVWCFDRWIPGILFRVVDFLRRAATIPAICLLVFTGSFVEASDQIVFRKADIDELWVMSSDGTNQHRILGSILSGDFGNVALSHSGDQVIYQVSDGNGNDELWSVRLDGTGNTEIVQASWSDCLAWIAGDNSVTYRHADDKTRGPASIYQKDLTTGVEQDFPQKFRDRREGVGDLSKRVEFRRKVVLCQRV